MPAGTPPCSMTAKALWAFWAAVLTVRSDTVAWAEPSPGSAGTSTWISRSASGSGALFHEPVTVTFSAGMENPLAGDQPVHT